ncbi:hypothetical protein JJL56_23010 [Azospirillum sp. YIM DDC1]|jgi:hypothetical protein|uniref:Uncharacterized protein n=1 Tax=Azospirillum aestuarii TaxID=2802052 RepID=A0ABS1I488_9PROT|nr:hypothetical protein [Azospirillum aestuarii]MBK3776166.1 hypothetical protein [Azospirillum brasilense]MBK4721729.1 hypothetical protein [Azospirillum aestuarii]TWA79641.1 hypothetical protein FBY14_12910 [Azospirillum brasilense]
MLNLSVVRKAIEDVEQAIAAMLAPETLAAKTVAMNRRALARLYTAYAQGLLKRHGIAVDLDDICGQCCHDCPDGRCARLAC